MKKNQRVQLGTELSEVIDTESCVLCGRLQPETLNLDQSITFVDLGCCMLCGTWEHLKCCTVIDKLSENDEFKSPSSD